MTKKKSFLLLKKVFVNTSIFRHFDLQNEIILKIDFFNEMIIGIFNQKSIDEFFYFICYYNKIMILTKI